MKQSKKLTCLSQPLLLSWNTLSTKFNNGTLTLGGAHCKEYKKVLNIATDICCKR